MSRTQQPAETGSKTLHPLVYHTRKKVCVSSFSMLRLYKETAGICDGWLSLPT